MSICPHCSGSNLRSEDALKRDGGATGFFCIDCKLAFIPHPDVKPQARPVQSAQAFEVGEIVTRPRAARQSQPKRSAKFIPQPGRVAGFSVEKRTPVGPHFVIGK